MDTDQQFIDAFHAKYDREMTRMVEVPITQSTDQEDAQNPTTYCITCGAKPNDDGYCPIAERDYEDGITEVCTNYSQICEPKNDQVEEVVEAPKKRTRKSMDDRIADIITVVEAHTLEHPTVPLSGKEVAEHAGMSMSTLRRVLDHIEGLSNDEDERAHCDYYECNGAMVWHQMFFDCGEDLTDQLFVSCERTDSGRYRTLDFSFAWDITDNYTGDVQTTTDGGDDDTPDHEEHQTGYAIDDDPEGKYKDNERYKCPHPNCDSNFNETAVRVEGGQDFCEHVMCTWVEHDGCTDCGVHIDADCICDEPQLRLEDLNREQLLAIVNGLENRDEYIKQELLEIGGNMADNAHYVMVGIKEAPVEGNEDIEEHINTWHFADGDKSEEDIINECIDNISSTYKVNYHTIQLIKYMGTSHDRGMGKYKSIVFSQTFDEDTDDDQDDDDGGHTTDGGDDNPGNGGDECSRMIGDAKVVFVDGCEYTDVGHCMNCGKYSEDHDVVDECASIVFTNKDLPVGLLESLFVNDDEHTGHNVSDATVCNYAKLAKKWKSDVRIEVDMDAPIKDFVIQSRMVDPTHVAMLSITANQGNPAHIPDLWDDGSVVVLEDTVESYKNGKQNFMHQLLMSNGIKGIDKKDSPMFSLDNMEDTPIPMVSFMDGKGIARSTLGSLMLHEGDLHKMNNFTLKMPNLKEHYLQEPTTMVQSFTERDLRIAIDDACAGIEITDWYQCTDEDGNELKGEYEAQKVKKGRALDGDTIIIGSGLYPSKIVKDIVSNMCAKTKSGKGSQTVHLVSSRDKPLTIIGEDWRVTIAPRVSEVDDVGNLLPTIDYHHLTLKHVLLQKNLDVKSVKILEDYNNALAALRTSTGGDE